MSSTINAATSGGLISTGDTSGQLQLQTAGTTALTVTSAQLVGVGTTSPSAPLEVYVQRTASTNATSIILNDNVTGAQTNGVYKSIQSRSNNGASKSEIRFLESDGTNNNTAIAFATANSAGGGVIERVRILNTGNIVCLSGGATNATGTGIAFPSSQDASSNANTLDDYEEGTFTPTIGGGSTFGTTTYQFTVNTNSEYGGTYTKIGNMVYCQITFGISAVSGGSGNVMIAGLPFTSTASPTPYASFMFGTINNLTHSGSRTQFGARTNNNTTTAYMWEFGIATGSTGDSPVAWTALCPSGAATNITCSVVYQTS